MEEVSFRSTAVLPYGFSEIVLFAVYRNHDTKQERVLALLIDKYKEPRLPVVKFDSAEPIEQTLRREVFSMSGCLLRYANMFGVMNKNDKNLICYVGSIGDVEDVSSDPKRLKLSIDDVIDKAMKEDFWQYSDRVNFLHYGYKEFQMLEKRYWESF